ncbi:MAG: hypothetical protein AAFO04_23725 [Cyanobacteria bacterium J06592_8]
MVVIPYTRLKPGIWELSCSPPDVQAALVSQSFDNQVKLRVLSNDSEPLEQISPTDDASTSDSSEKVVESEKIVEIVDERNTPLEPQSDLTATDSTPNSETEVTPDSPQPVTTPSNTVDFGQVELTLTLEQDSFVAKLGQAFFISGQIEVATSESSSEPSSEYYLDQPHLDVYLRDPQNSHILLQVQQAVPQSSLPIPFSCLVYIPFECKTRLILGEIVISSHGKSVTSHSFTIATQVEHLLTAIDTGLSSTEEINVTLETNEPNPVESQNRLRLIDPNAVPIPKPATSEPLSRRPTVPVTQPISQSSPPDSTSSSSLELPTFGNFLSDTPEQPIESTTTSSPTPTPTSQQTPEEEAEEEILTPVNETVSELPVETTSSETNSSEIDDLESEEAQLVPVSPVDPAFRALRLENRFWSRLNSLAQDQDLSQWMKQAKPTPLPDTSFVQTRPDESPKTPIPTPPPDPDPLFPSLEDEFESQEIVVDDEPLESPTVSASSPPRLRLINSPSTQPPTTEESTAISEQGPIPAPLLEVIDPEIVAGRTVKVRVQMDENIPRTYVKIWVYDRQSRGIVDGPRWLTEFLPNGLGQIETMVNLQIAYGSLEVQFEAIAVEMQTQRESHKVIVERSVIPTSPPTLPLDEE